MQKKILSLALSAVLVLSLVACGSNKTALSGSASQGSTGIKVGMVTDVGGVNDQSFNQTSWEGLKKLDAANPNITAKYLESKTDADYASNIQIFLDEGYDLVICVGYMLANATREAAQANPNRKFAIIDDDSNKDLPNVACLMFAQEQASYLVGVVAAMMTKSQNIGYVQGMVSDTMNLFGIGYIAGAESINPTIKVQQYNANNFADAAAGSAAVQNFVTNGADVVYHAAGGTGAGVISACEANKIYAIGVDSDQSYIAPNTVCTSAMKRVDTAAQDISLAVLNGNFTGGVHKYDLSNAGVDIAPTTTLLTPEIIDKVNQVKNDIISGRIVVPTKTSECPSFTLK